jgi:Flp pilus assembly protein TadB/uncharacterized protein YegL
MMTSRSVRALIAVAIAVTVLPGYGVADAAPAHAPSAQITNLEATAQQLQFVLAVRGLPTGGTVDVASIRVSADGQPLTAHAKTSGTQADGSVLPLREAMLVLDISGSMEGSRLTAAKAAALSYLKALPADVKAGLVTFANRPKVVLAPTANRAALRAALTHVTADGNTALYDAILSAVTALGGNQSNQRRLLILSDGADTTSKHSLAAVIAAIKRSGVSTDAVGIGLSGTQRVALTQITAAGSGRVLSTSSLGELSSAFVEAAQTFSQQILVSAETPASMAAKRITITATVKAAGRDVTASGNLRLPALSASSATSSSGPATGAAPLSPAKAHLPVLLLALTFLGLFGVGILLLWKPKSGNSRQHRLDQLSAYRWSAPDVPVAPGKPAEGTVTTAALSLVDGVLRSAGSRSRISTDLERAGLRLRPQEWILLRISVGVTLIAILTVLTRSPLIGLLIGSLVGWLGTRGVLRLKIGRRCAAFSDQLPDVLQLVASSLRSGFSLSQALDGVVREGSEPAASEFARALTESRLGLDLEDALDGVAERVRCRDLTWVVMAIRISRDVGGNLAEVLLTTVHTMRERGQLKRQVRALSAEGRLSAYILIALPVFVASWFALVRPEYLRPLYTDPMGIVMLVFGAIGMVVGSWWMSRIVKVEV